MTVLSDWVVIEYSDRGKGISDDQKETVFQGAEREAGGGKELACPRSAAPSIVTAVRSLSAVNSASVQFSRSCSKRANGQESGHE